MIPQTILYEVGGTIDIYRKTRPSTATVTLKKFNGNAVFEDESATISTINTTVATSALSQGDTSLIVASATGIAQGSRFWIQDDPEEVVVKSVSGTTVTLRRPLLHDHVVGATVEGTRISYAVSSSYADSMFWDGYAEWTLDGSLTDKTSACCLRCSAQRLASVVDLFDIDSRLYNKFPKDFDFERALDNAHEYVLRKLASNGRIYQVSTGMEFIRATALAVFMNYYMPLEGSELYSVFKDKVNEAINDINIIVPKDYNQDGKITSDEHHHRFGSVKIQRA